MTATTSLHLSPSLTKWVIKYDEIYGMPQFIQGIVIGVLPSILPGVKSGTQVMLRNIETLDLKQKHVQLSTGEKFHLVGEGSRMLILPNDSEYGIVKLSDIETDEDDDS